MIALPVAGQHPTKTMINAGPSGAGWSSIEAAIRCERLFYFQRIHRRAIASGDAAATEPTPPAFPLVRGAIGHVGLAHEYARRNAKKFNIDPETYYTRDEAMTIAAESWGMKAKCVDGTSVEEILEEHARPTVTDYFNYRDSEREHLPVVGIECLDEMLLPNGKLITQRMDLVTYDTGKYFIYDHKFSTETHMAKLVSRYSLSGQFLLMQLLGAKRYGREFGGLRLNILIANQGLKAEARFKRFAPEPSPAALAEFPAVAAARRDRIDSLKGQPMSAYLPALNEMICVNNYEGRCSAYQLCQWGTGGAQ